MNSTCVEFIVENGGVREFGLIEVLDETGARETKSLGVLNERALGIGRLIFGWHLPFHVAQIRDARALDGKPCGYFANRSLMAKAVL